MSIPSFPRRAARTLAAALCLAGAYTTQAHADAVVGTGNSASCDETAFNVALTNITASNGGTITFDCGAAPVTITLTAGKSITKNTSIDGGAVSGGGKGLITLNANNVVRHFTTFGAATLDLKNLSLVNGSAHDGGAINTQATTMVTLTDVTLEGNNTAGFGGAIFTGNGTTINLTRVFAIDNHADANTGGAIYAQGTAVLNLKQFVADHNTSKNGGGAIEHHGSALTIADSLFLTNKANADNAGGGAIEVNAGTTTSLDISNTTFFNNGLGSSNPAGAIWLSGVVNGKINNSTFANNYGNGAITIYNSTATMSNTIVSATVSGPNCATADNISSLGNGGNNLQFGGSVAQSCGASVTTADPMLSLLTDNGGFSKTMALLAGSPAIDAGNDATCAATDQRGIARPIGPHCDIGAFEAGAAPAAVAPAITNGPPPNGTVGIAYNFAYTATGTAPIAFNVTSGSLPPGLTLSSAGVISGTPTTFGNYSATVTASNGTAPNATQQFTVSIAASTQPPSAATASAPSLGIWGMLAMIALLTIAAAPRRVAAGRKQQQPH